jgi:hypothetical protein
MKKEALGSDDPQSLDNRRLSAIARNPNHPMHTHAKAELDRRKMKNEGAMKRIATTQANKADRMASGGKKGLETFKKKESQNETKGAPKGYHFTRSGKLRKGDAGADGPGGAKLRSDPLDKQRSKIPPLPEAYNEPQGQAKRIMSPLQKVRMDKEKADRDRDGKLMNVKTKTKTEATMKSFSEISRSKLGSYVAATEDVNEAATPAMKNIIGVWPINIGKQWMQLRKTAIMKLLKLTVTKDTNILFSQTATSTKLDTVHHVDKLEHLTVLPERVAW